jgi:hypothetical protein
MITIGSSFDDFDFVVDSLQLPSVNGMVAVVEDPIAMSLDGISELGDSFVTDSSGQGTPFIDGLVGPGPRPIRPDVFQILFEDQDCINDCVQFQEFFQMFPVFRSADVGSVFQQQIFGSFDNSFVGLGRFAVFAVSDFVDDAVEQSHHMKQVEDDGHMRDFLLDGQNIGFPHIHNDGVQSLSLTIRHSRKEPFKRSCLAIFAHPDHSASLIVQNDRQIAVAFADRDLVDGQDAKSLIIGLTIVLFQKPAIDGFDRFPVQSQMFGHLLDSHEPAQFVNIPSQSVGDPQIGIEQIQVLDQDTLTLGAEDLSILTLDPDSGRAEVQIPDCSLLFAVNSDCLAATDMAQRMKPLVWNDFNPSTIGFLGYPLLDDTNFGKRKIWSDAQRGHSGPPLDIDVSNQYISYPLEVPDVHLCFQT